ncbi:MAG: NAD(P)-dependent oxidoreductase, partial [Prochlorotrichaceae cyanobacterium]
GEGRNSTWLAQQGHQVTAFGRNFSKLDIQAPQLQRVQGDVMDLAMVKTVVQDQDAVICILGSGKKLTGNIRSEGTRQIIRAMQETGIRRLICQSTLGAGDSWGSLNFYWKYIMFGCILRQVFNDHEKQEAYVRQSQLDWTIVRPGAFLDGDRTGHYRHGFPGSDQTTQLKISRADVADFILKQLGDRSYLHQAPSLSY